jgi:hypothetical protein
MKQFPFFNPAFVAVTAVHWLASATVFAQLPGADSSAGVSAAMTKLFGNLTAFSAQSEVRVLGKDQKEIITTPMRFALLDKKIRVEVDTSQVKNKDMPAAALASMKQLGMDRVISVTRPDKRATYIIFPRVQSYVNVVLSKEDAEAFEKNPKIEKTALGKETIDSHPCVKNKVVITDAQGQKNEATVWYATDLKDFPVQVQTADKENTMVMHYRDIQLARPDAKLFAPPAGFTEYKDVQQLMQAAMKKMLGGQIAK